MDHPRFQRALMLYQQSRNDLAESELRQLFAEAPNHARGHALLARLLVARERYDEAAGEAMQAIHLAPDDAFAYLAMSEVMFRANRFREAEQAAQEAIALDPDWSASFAILSQIHLAERRWPDALAAAERGLAIDPQNVACANLKAMALVKLGQPEQAQAIINETLRQNPEDATTHANQGWTLLQNGKPTEALEHFREALRLDPSDESARSGVVESLKAKNFVYRAMLGYFFWMARLGRGAQWAILIGGWIGFRMLRGVAANNPALAPFLMPLLIAYIAFAVMTWVAVPLANMLLRFNRFGRLALNREQVITSNLIGGCVAVAVLFLGAAVMFRESAFLFGALVCGLLMPPVSCIFNCQRGWPRVTLAAITIVLAALGAGALALMIAPLIVPSIDEKTLAAFDGFAEKLSLAFLIGAVASQFAANALVMARVQR